MGKSTETYQGAKDRERKALPLVAAGGVTTDGGPGLYYVDSQSGEDPDQVDVIHGRCGCPDSQFCGSYCKHTRAAEIYAARKAVGEATPTQVVLEVRGYAQGQKFLDKRISRVRIGDGKYRAPTNSGFDAALKWLAAHGYEQANVVGPQRRIGTQLARYFYRQNGGN